MEFITLLHKNYEYHAALNTYKNTVHLLPVGRLLDYWATRLLGDRTFGRQTIGRKTIRRQYSTVLQYSTDITGAG